MSSSMSNRTLLTHDRVAALDVATPGLSFLPVREGLWRVVALDGAVLGHIERRPVAGAQGCDAGEVRFAARTARVGRAAAVPLGEFWNAADAAECFR